MFTITFSPGHFINKHILCSGKWNFQKTVKEHATPTVINNCRSVGCPHTQVLFFLYVSGNGPLLKQVIMSSSVQLNRPTDQTVTAPQREANLILLVEYMLSLSLDSPLHAAGTAVGKRGWLLSARSNVYQKSGIFKDLAALTLAPDFG